MAEKNSANIGFEKQIWDAACVLWGHIPAAEYRKVIVGLIFLRYISNAFEKRYDELVAEGDGFEDDRDAYAEDNIFFVPENARWKKIASSAHTPEIGTVIDEAMRAIEAENKSLKNVLPKNYASPDLDKRVLGDVVDLFTNMDMGDTEESKDLLGRTYEYCIAQFAAYEGVKGGEFYTPASIVKTIVAILKPFENCRVYDPACGTAGFLVSSAEFIRAHYEDTMTSKQWERFAGPMFTGFDTDRTMLRISAMNLTLHSIGHPEVDYRDSVSKQNQIRNKFTVCLANPPFKGTVDAESINDDLKAVTNTKKTELLFLALFLRMLKNGGRCACIVPDGVLFGSSKAHKSIRRELVENHQLRAVISMPSGVFKPYAGVSTAVLVFTKTGAGGTENVWFYDMKADGFSLDDKRGETQENDIPDIIRRFHNLDGEAGRQRTEQSFLVPKAEIAGNDYDLSINKYKKVEYVPVEYPPTGEILDELERMEEGIMAGLAELRGMV